MAIGITVPLHCDCTYTENYNRQYIPAKLVKIRKKGQRGRARHQRQSFMLYNI